MQENISGWFFLNTVYLFIIKAYQAILPLNYGQWKWKLANSYKMAHRNIIGWADTLKYRESVMVLVQRQQNILTNINTHGHCTGQHPGCLATTVHTLQCITVHNFGKHYTVHFAYLLPYFLINTVNLVKQCHLSLK